MITIRFPRTQHDTLGRNGYTASCGIAVSNMTAEVFLEPINSTGETGRARLVIPRTHLRELREAIDLVLSDHNTP